MPYMRFCATCRKPHSGPCPHGASVGWGSRYIREIMPAATRRAVIQHQGGRCAACGVYTNRLEIDHKTPISQGGTNHEGNLQALCRGCHLHKSKREAAWGRLHA